MNELAVMRELLLLQRDIVALRAECTSLRAKLESASQAYDCAMAIHGTVMEERDRLHKVLVDIYESRNACGCTPVCHCNDNVAALLAWKEATIEDVYTALNASKKESYG